MAREVFGDLVWERLRGADAQSLALTRSLGYLALQPFLGPPRTRPLAGAVGMPSMPDSRCGAECPWRKITCLLVSGAAQGSDAKRTYGAHPAPALSIRSCQSIIRLTCHIDRALRPLLFCLHVTAVLQVPVLSLLRWPWDSM